MLQTLFLSITAKSSFQGASEAMTLTYIRSVENRFQYCNHGARTENLLEKWL